jgi:glyoxylase-like metal-dependent hydrolase (beta-lactamase superfamily II)
MSDDRHRPQRRRRKELARADRVMPGVWRLRLPLPWPGVPHGNAYAVVSGSGVVLFDTGMHQPGALGQLELALDQAGLRLDHVRLLVCTHAHSDHYGLAAPIIEASGCELWMHPNLEHMRKNVEDPDRQVERRLEVALASGVPAESVERAREARKGTGSGVAELVEPDRDLLPGVEVDTDLGRWQVYETPGHAPSHVVLHQPDRRLLVSGDHILGRISLYYDYGWTPDPAGEYLSSLDTVESLPTDLILAGHGKPVRDLPGLVSANRRAVHERMGRVREAIAMESLTPYDIVPKLMQTEDLNPMLVSWGLSETLAYLRHLEITGEAEKEEGSDPERWRLTD